MTPNNLQVLVCGHSDCKAMKYLLTLKGDATLPSQIEGKANQELTLCDAHTPLK